MRDGRFQAIRCDEIRVGDVVRLVADEVRGVGVVAAICIVVFSRYSVCGCVCVCAFLLA